MSKRPTIRDVAERAGVSVATVDRVLNARSPVRARTTEQVLRAADDLDYNAKALVQQRTQETAPRMTLGFLLQKANKQFYQQFAADLAAETSAEQSIRGSSIIEFMEELSPTAISERMRDLGRRVDALAVVAVDHPRVAAEIEALRDTGVPTFAVLSDLNAPAKAGYIGINSRMAGRTAGWAIARLAKRAGDVGVLIGSHRYLGQEDQEIGFRGFFRESFPEFRILEPVVYQDDANVAYGAASELFARNPDLVGYYHCGGGVGGALRAAEEKGMGQRLVIACHSLTPSSRAGLMEGVIDMVISAPTGQIARQTVMAMAAAIQAGGGADRQIQVPFEIYTSENI